jgi:outer membrane receptor protein involved in Fe transport
MAKWSIHIFTFFSITVHAQNTGGWVSSSASYRELEQIIITASRRLQSLKIAPVSLISVSGEHLRTFSVYNLIDMLQRIRGVHLITTSLGLKALNSRGLVNTTNVRFVPLVDGYVPSYSTVDIVLGERLPTFPVWNFRIAASNAFNRYYVSYLGGPRIGGIYSFTATYNIFE